jgi:predicted nuclease of predicted toxin-antitoxin system
MKILFDHGTPAPLRRALAGHLVSTAFEMGWSNLSNGELLNAAESIFDVLVTTDQNLRHQQNLTGRRLAIVILPTTNWPRIRLRLDRVIDAINASRPGAFVVCDLDSK